jgi:hypothetical protein
MATQDTLLIAGLAIGGLALAYTAWQASRFVTKLPLNKLDDIANLPSDAASAGFNKLYYGGGSAVNDVLNKTGLTTSVRPIEVPTWAVGNKPSPSYNPTTGRSLMDFSSGTPKPVKQTNQPVIITNEYGHTVRVGVPETGTPEYSLSNLLNFKVM